MFITVRSSSMFIKFLVDPHLLCSILITSPPAPSAIIAPHIHLLPVAPPAPALVQKAAGGGALKAHLRVPSRSWRMRCFPKNGIVRISWGYVSNGMATARNVGTAGWIFFINFAHRVKAHNNICLVYTKFNALSYGCKWSLFGVGLSLYMVWCTFSTQLDTLLLK